MAFPTLLLIIVSGYNSVHSTTIKVEYNECLAAQRNYELEKRLLDKVEIRCIPLTEIDND